ncbi:MAG: hypothetical protein CR991_04630 [Proteobacteria bacterium]|nr:MAG: hypothetical protein CR991_04630 [Pseudomonadota bacterium]
MYIDYLTEQGYKAELTENKYIIFKRQGHTLFIDIQEKDLAFFRVALPNIWPIETEEERAKVLVASDRASSIVKVAKVYTVEDDVWICVELFVNQPEDFKGLFERSLSAIEDAVFVFTTHMRHENLAH